MTDWDAVNRAVSDDGLGSAGRVTEPAILAPVPARDRIAPNAESDAVHGAHKMLVESHVQHDILSSQHLSRLPEYRVVVLPGPNDYAPEVYPALEQWVRDGGVLIACGGALMHAGRFELAEAFGIEHVEQSVFSVSHFKPRPGTRGHTDDLVLQCRAATQKIIPAGADILADYYFPQGESTPERAFRNPACAPPADEPSPFPFATAHKHGKGLAAYVAGDLFDAYWKYNHHWLRQFMHALYGHVYPHTAVRGDLPQSIETNLMRTGGGDLLLNLIHYQVGHQGDKDAIPSIEKVYPVHHLTCEVRTDSVSRVVLEPEGQEIEHELKDGYVRFTVPAVEYLGMVRIVPKA